MTSNDPRFGEFRLGAFPQAGVLANALPYQPLAGTWSGNVLLNTQANWFLADWAPGAQLSVPAPNAKGPAVEFRLQRNIAPRIAALRGLIDELTARKGTQLFSAFLRKELRPLRPLSRRSERRSVDPPVSRRRCWL